MTELALTPDQIAYAHAQAQVAPPISEQARTALAEIFAPTVQDLSQQARAA